MTLLPRLAVGTIQAESDPETIVWALLAALHGRGIKTQAFHSRCCFAAHDAAAVITGQSARHLDSWLMSEDVCLRTFLRRAESVDLALVEGRFDGTTEEMPLSLPRRGGSLDELCRWLDLPQVAVVDCSLLSDCALPKRPRAEAILLDRVANIGDRFRWQTVLESLWGIPVLGAMPEAASWRREAAELPRGGKPSRELCAALGDALADGSNLQSLLRLASRRALAYGPAPPGIEQVFSPRGDVRVAVAYDEAFHCYFPDTLDMLEMRGATVRVFSPLRDESLPSDTDLVYVGCGRPHEYARELAENHCMLMALKEHICSGRRVYAEGGGLAYLCQHVELADGTLAPMVGALQALARRSSVWLDPEPVEVTLAGQCWLGGAGTRLRGYRNRNWHLEPTVNVAPLASEPDSRLDLIGRHQAIGSRLHLNLAAQPSLLGGFLRPCPPSLAWARA